ncbi:hypothetical protein QA641_38040 [Bradyrhizobium sp. CB1650]|uniref:hypothetical protein n=1 Tax=Bradyrhizobium sp. CB1650 TaxID=3039153 RepID=UPI002435D6C1|nr:hypothetical protein [Bradyrhizobium sp. CB1650]WGD51229.1 hypothetical protein QA641_38040 [Bradyrhizobium sp. CB1650]
MSTTPSGNHESLKSEIQNCKKARSYTPLSCKIKHCIKANSTDRSRPAAFFTGDDLLLLTRRIWVQRQPMRQLTITRQKRVRFLEKAISDRGRVIALSYHHLEELVSHQREVVQQRISYIQSLSMVAAISSFRGVCLTLQSFDFLANSAQLIIKLG